MIKFVSKDFKDIKIGSKQVVKVTQGIDVKWELMKDNLVFSGTGRSSYDISVQDLRSKRRSDNNNIDKEDRWKI